MAGFIPFDRTLKDFQLLLKQSAFSGSWEITSSDVIDLLRQQPIYDTDYVAEEITKALSTSNEERNCITGDGTELVIVTPKILEYVLSIVRDGGMKHDEDE